MYSVTVPLFNHSVTDSTRNTYLKQFKEAKIDRILLCVFGYGTDPETDEITALSIKKNIDFFRNEGIEAGVWIGYTIGHGSNLAVNADFVPDLSGFAKIVDLSGQEQENVCCPLDENFRKRISKYVSTIAAMSGTSLVLLDDDYRMSQHGREFCCACDAHMGRIHQLCGEEISREELRELVFAKKANQYRDAWLTAQREGLELLAADIRAAVDERVPNVRVGICTAHALYGVDGTDPVRIARILAGGNTMPFIRTHGAPYWTRSGKRHLLSVFELARAFAFLCDSDGVEMISEGDTYPRPRYIVPSSYLEAFDAVMRVDGRHDGILKYMVDYLASPEFETSYLRYHIRNLPVMEQISEMFDGKDMLGVNVTCHRDTFDGADLEMGLAGYYPDTPAGAAMAFSGISTVYGEGGICRAVFGEEARHVSLSEIEKGGIIDAIAAQILTDRGIDVGLEERVSFTNARVSYLTDEDLREKAYVDAPQIRYADFRTASDAKVVCNAYFGEEIKKIAYTYKNSKGARFLVYCFDSMAFLKHTGIYRGYLQQRILREGVEWISNKRLPAFMEGCPDTYLMCKGKNGRMAVAIFNMYADSIDEPIIKLDRTYSSIRFLNCSGRLEADRVVLNEPIYGYTFVAFEVM